MGYEKLKKGDQIKMTLKLGVSGECKKSVVLIEDKNLVWH